MAESNKGKIPRSLSKAQAEENLKILGEKPLSYGLTLIFKEEGISGTVMMDFNTVAEGTLSVCYRRGTIHEATLNGEELSLEAYDSEIMPIEVGEAQACQLSIKFEGTYSEVWGDGPVLLDFEGQKFLYTVHEYYGTSRFFPCLDQPSLRGEFTLNATYPSSWGKIWSNGEIVKSEDVEMKSVWFNVSEPLPTYLFYVFIGNYYEKVCPQNDITHIPQSYLCMPHAQEKMDPIVDVMNRVTSYALVFLEGYLQCSYPFKRYHHIFIPSGYVSLAGNELPGMVFVDEYYLDQDSDYYWPKWLFILCHELAHMWFGDLVAIEFWDQIWLKESFADLLAMLCYEHLATLQSTEQIDLGMGPDPYQRVNLMKFSRRLDGFKHTDKMLKCGKCRPIIKKDIENTDQVFTCYDDDIYGKSMFDLHQFLSAYDGCLRDTCCAIVKNFAWQYINEERFFSILHANDKFLNAVGADEITRAFESTFKEVGYDKIQVSIQEEKIQLNQLQITKRFHNICVSKENDSQKSYAKAGSKNYPSSFSQQGEDIIIDSDFYASCQYDINFDEYIEQITDESLKKYVFLVLSQLIQSKAKISDDTFERILSILKDNYLQYFADWIDVTNDYSGTAELSDDTIKDIMKTIENDFFKMKTVKMDYFDVFASIEGYNEEENGLRYLKFILPLLNKPPISPKYFDYIAIRKFTLHLMRDHDNLDLSSQHLIDDVLRLVCIPHEAKKLASKLHPTYSLADLMFANRVREANEMITFDPEVAKDDELCEEVEERGGNTMVLD